MSGYLNEQAQVGDRFVMTEPSGEFHYETLRDSRNILCVAGGSGITPFVSMAGSLAEGDEDYSMTLFYGARTAAQLAYKDELEALAARCEKLKVVYVLSDEEQPGCEKGFVSAELMKKYAELAGSTFFLCGPKAMYDFIDKELAPLQLPVKALHRDASCCGDLPLEQPAEFRLTVHMRDEVFEVPARENETLLTAMERAGLNAPNKCRAGGCGFCHSKWIAGSYRVAEGRDGRREADRKFGFIPPASPIPWGTWRSTFPWPIEPGAKQRNRKNRRETCGFSGIIKENRKVRALCAAGNRGRHGAYQIEQWGADAHGGPGHLADKGRRGGAGHSGRSGSGLPPAGYRPHV